MQSFRPYVVPMTYNENETDQARSISIERVLRKGSPVARTSAKFETSPNQNPAKASY